MRSHPWKFELSGGREGVQIALLGKELSVRGVQAFALGSRMRQQLEEHGYTLPVELSLCSFENIQPLSQVFGFLSSAFLSDKVGLHRFCPPATLTLTSPAAEGKPFSLLYRMGPFSQWLCFSYLPVTFFIYIPLGMIFYFLHPLQVRHLHFLTSGLCCSAGL